MLRSLASLGPIRPNPVRSVPVRAPTGCRAVTTTPRSLSRETSAASTGAGRSASQTRVRLRAGRPHGTRVQRDDRPEVVGKLDHPHHGVRPAPVGGGHGMAEAQVQAAQRGRTDRDLTGLPWRPAGSEPHQPAGQRVGEVEHPTVHDLVAVRAAQRQRDAPTHLGDPAARPQQGGHLRGGDPRGGLAVAVCTSPHPTRPARPGCSAIHCNSASATPSRRSTRSPGVSSAMS